MERLNKGTTFLLNNVASSVVCTELFNERIFLQCILISVVADDICILLKFLHDMVSKLYIDDKDLIVTLQDIVVLEFTRVECVSIPVASFS